MLAVWVYARQAIFNPFTPKFKEYILPAIKEKYVSEERTVKQRKTANRLFPLQKPSDGKKSHAKSQSKSRKPSKKDAITVDPNNIDLATFSSADMMEHMDAELRQFIEEEQSKKQGETKGGERERRQSVVQTLEMPQVAEEVSENEKGAYSPSKVKRASKKELARERAEKRKEERMKKEEEKKRKEEEMRLVPRYSKHTLG